MEGASSSCLRGSDIQDYTGDEKYPIWFINLPIVIYIVLNAWASRVVDPAIRRVCMCERWRREGGWRGRERERVQRSRTSVLGVRCSLNREFC